MPVMFNSKCCALLVTATLFINVLLEDIPPEVPMVIQERAYSSPIWYSPATNVERQSPRYGEGLVDCRGSCQ